MSETLPWILLALTVVGGSSLVALMLMGGGEKGSVESAGLRRFREADDDMPRSSFLDDGPRVRPVTDADRLRDQAPMNHGAQLARVLPARHLFKDVYVAIEWHVRKTGGDESAAIARALNEVQQVVREVERVYGLQSGTPADLHFEDMQGLRHAAVLRDAKLWEREWGAADQKNELLVQFFDHASVKGAFYKPPHPWDADSSFWWDRFLQLHSGQAAIREDFVSKSPRPGKHKRVLTDIFEGYHVDLQGLRPLESFNMEQFDLLIADAKSWERLYYHLRKRESMVSYLLTDLMQRQRQRAIGASRRAAGGV